MTRRAWRLAAMGIVLVWATVLIMAVVVAAHAGTAAAPCRTRDYRTRVVNVLGTSESLLAASDGAYKALKIGHVRAARQALRSVHDYLPTYYYREGRLVNMTTGCGI